jgi:hypothetical protein
VFNLEVLLNNPLLAIFYLLTPYLLMITLDIRMRE